MPERQEWLNSALAGQLGRQRTRERVRRRKAALYAPISYPTVVDALRPGDRVQVTAEALPWLLPSFRYGIVARTYRHRQDGTPMVEVILDDATGETCWSANCWERGQSKACKNAG